MTAFFQSFGMTYEWAWFVATIVGILVIALPLMLAVAMNQPQPAPSRPWNQTVMRVAPLHPAGPASGRPG